VPLKDQLRQLPSVDEVARALEGLAPHSLLVAEIRRALDGARAALRAGSAEPVDIVRTVREALESLRRPSLRRVINATGVVLHTNLGRAPLPALEMPGAYSNLEYDLATGKRGKRDSHTSVLLERLLGRPAIAVNNGAAAVWLALLELAAGGEAIVSRGELIEIGDGFRIPAIMAQSGARLVEVGTTNKTRIEDYLTAITPQTKLLMRVHPSNFRMEGFTGRPALEELTALGREKGIPVYEDLGSGCLFELQEYGVSEPTTAASFAAGADVVSFSGDKLLGGPQAGILAGKSELIQRLRRNPMFRALRLDKLQVLALETAARHLLFEEWEQMPTLQMIRQNAASIRARTERFLEKWPGAPADIIAGESLLGGGSTPEQKLPTALLALRGDATALELRLRQGEPPVIARIENEKVLLDLRTVAPDEEDDLLRALRAAY
jgi:L-seryl-tRNA(Ser) seleniumtransferase